MALFPKSNPRAARRLASLVTASFLPLSGCGKTPTPAAAVTPPPAASPAPAQPAEAPVPVFTFQVVRSFPHDPAAFTQGLQFLDGVLLESTGLNGRSSLRKVELDSGRVLQRIDVPATFFAEGATVLNGKVYQLTWQNRVGFVYDYATFTKEREFAYVGEGWGLTTDGRSLILSNGSSQIRFLDPATFLVTRTIDVTLQGKPLGMLNELEFIHGEIYANIWQTSAVARIDPTTGRVTSLIDFTGLLPREERTPETDVLNGIAYDATRDRLFITGKNWPKLYEVKLVPKPATQP